MPPHSKHGSVNPGALGGVEGTALSSTTSTTVAAAAAVRDQWVKVTWMPHTSLSPTSHVCMCIRSVHACLNDIVSRGSRRRWRNEKFQDEWRIRIGIYGIAGLELIPGYSYTTTATVNRRSYKKEVPSFEQVLHPTVLGATHDCVWDCFVNLPICWRDLPRDAYLHFEILDHTNEVVFQATMPFFSPYGKLKTGLQCLQLQSSPLDDSKNHGLEPLRPWSEREAPEDPNEDPVWRACQILDRIGRAEDERARGMPPIFGKIPSVPWLDAFEKRRNKQAVAAAYSKENEGFYAKGDEKKAKLIVELPTFDIPILYEETFYPVPQHGASGAVAPLDLSLYRKEAARNDDPYHFDPLQLVPFLDYENEDDNPVEDKYRTLAHDLLRGLVDPALKPDREQRDRLAAIIESPAHHPTREEKDLLWRFRFSLVDNRRALTKFLLAVDWTVESEVVQAAELLEQWRKRSPIEVTDALKLLGKHVAFQTNLVRDYAIDTLAAAPDSELRLYLLQLVQALKYESSGLQTQASKGSSVSTTSGSNKVSPLANFLINRAAGSMELANYFYWYLKVEMQNPTHGARYRDVFSALEMRLSETPFIVQGHADEVRPAASFKSIVNSVSKIGSTLRGGAEHHAEKERTIKPRSMWETLVQQDKFITGILDVQRRCREMRGKKDVKEAELLSLLEKEGFDRKPNREPIPIACNPEMLVNGVRPETAKMFKSALYPALIEFHVDGFIGDSKTASTTLKSKRDEKPTVYKAIVKTGDDLRQDQLIIMMIQLMDRLLKRAALDLCLTPYSIIATSPTSGLVEFVDGAIPISAILSNYNGSIMQFLQSTAPQEGAKYNVRPDVMSTYVRSCAGYCVITFLLGVGDRHLDNILLRASGHFFHIDFGFIFGRDPKPLPPAFRLTREMVDGMGGIDSSEYRQFCSLACQAFNALRKSAGLVLNLLHLMSDAGIEDLSNNPSSNAEDVINKVEDRFRLDLTDEQAERYFLGLINDCLAAIAPRVMDVFHAFSVARR